MSRGGGHRVHRETGRAISITRRLGQRLVFVLRQLELRDGEAAALLRGATPAEAKGAKITGPEDIGASGMPTGDWIEAYKEYNKALLGYLSERRRFALAMKGAKGEAADNASDSEAIITALMLATPEEREEAERRLLAQAKPGAPIP